MHHALLELSHFKLKFLPICILKLFLLSSSEWQKNITLAGIRKHCSFYFKILLVAGTLGPYPNE